MRIGQALRLNNWWSAKIPPLLAVGYVQVLLSDMAMGRAVALLGCLLFSIASVAAYGHVINDIFDIAADLRAGKPNSMVGVKRHWQALLCVGLVAAGFLPTLVVNYTGLGVALLVLNYLWPTVYSWPGLRLKERGIWGVLCDAAGSHITPTLLVLAVFLPAVGFTPFAPLAVAWAIVIGIKGILYHQVADRENDRRSATATFASTQRLGRLEQFLPWYNMLIEMPISVGLVTTIYPACPLCAGGLAIYVALEVLKYRLRFQFALSEHPSTLRRSIPFANNLFYEFWFPLSLMLQLGNRTPEWLWLTAVHSLAFHQVVRQQAGELQAIFAGLARKLRLRRHWARVFPRASKLQNVVMIHRRRTVTPERCEQAVQQAIRFLRRQQTSYGELLTQRGERADLADSLPDSSIFTTCNALCCLEHAPEDLVDDIRVAGARFLLEQMEEGGLWRYWSDHAEKRKRIPLDADDTACAAFALRLHRPDVFHGANVERLLRYRTQDGLFLTWLDDPAPFGWANDVDAIVNANVLLYLGDRVETHSISAHLCGLIENDREVGSYHYYCNDLALYYSLSRAYFHGCRSLENIRERLHAKVLRFLNQDDINELDCALALCTLMNIGAVHSPIHDNLAAALVHSQQRSGGWRKRAYWQGVRGAGYYGSEELVTVLSVEALCRYHSSRVAGEATMRDSAESACIASCGG